MSLLSFLWLLVLWSVADSTAAAHMRLHSLLQWLSRFKRDWWFKARSLAIALLWEHQMVSTEAELGAHKVWLLLPWSPDAIFRRAKMVSTALRESSVCLYLA
jgi:hypothetical protein